VETFTGSDQYHVNTIENGRANTDLRHEMQNFLHEQTLEKSTIFKGSKNCSLLKQLSVSITFFYVNYLRGENKKKYLKDFY